MLVVNRLPLGRIQLRRRPRPLDIVHPGVISGRAAFGVNPFERMDAGADGIFGLLPVLLACDLALVRTIDIELQII